MSEIHDVTGMLQSLGSGDTRVLDHLFPVVYDELRGIAGARLRAERAGHTLSATGLVHEAYLKLVEQKTGWQNRGHFFAIAARAMRRILLDHAVARRAAKRGGDAPMVTLGDEVTGRDAALDDVIAIDEALQKLAALNARQERIVELRYFGGLKLDEVADVMDLSLATVNRDWRMARAFLAAELSD